MGASCAPHSHEASRQTASRVLVARGGGRRGCGTEGRVGAGAGGLGGVRRSPSSCSETRMAVALEKNEERLKEYSRKEQQKSPGGKPRTLGAVPALIYTYLWLLFWKTCWRVTPSFSMSVPKVTG